MKEQSEKERMESIINKIASPVKKKKKEIQKYKRDSNGKRFNRRVMNYRKKIKEKTKVLLSLLPETDTYKKETPILALDCEMVICEDNQRHLARLSIVNFNRHVIFDEYIKPQKNVKNYLKEITNIDSFKVSHSETFDFYKKKIFKLLENKILVGHTLEKDFDVMGFLPKKMKIRDISEFKIFMEGKFKRKLSKLCEEFLKIKIQGGTHSSVEDARAALEMYKLYQKEIDLFVKDDVFKKEKRNKRLGLEQLV